MSVHPQRHAPAKPKAPATIKRALRAIRRHINTTPDVIEKRIAYEIECAIRWATEPGIRGWPSPVQMAVDAAHLLRHELEREGLVIRKSI